MKLMMKGRFLIKNVQVRLFNNIFTQYSISLFSSALQFYMFINIMSSVLAIY